MKILICGDSYMAVDPVRKHMNHMHWSRHLGKDINITNVAMPGASNTMILMQLQNAIFDRKFDGIVLGFTCAYRIEFSKRTTGCHVNDITEDQKKTDAMYRQHVHDQAELVRNMAVIEYTILLARKHAPTVFALNGFDNSMVQRPSRYLVDFHDQLSMSLIGHKEFDAVPPTGNNYESMNWAGFHVSDPEVHLRFAKQVRDSLLEQMQSTI